MTTSIHEINTTILFNSDMLGHCSTLLNEALKTEVKVVVFASEANQLKFKTLLRKVLPSNRVILFKPFPTKFEPIIGVQGKVVIVLDDRNDILHYPILPSLTQSDARSVVVFHTGPSLTQ